MILAVAIGVQTGNSIRVLRGQFARSQSTAATKACLRQLHSLKSGPWHLHESIRAHMLCPLAGMGYPFQLVLKISAFEQLVFRRNFSVPIEQKCLVLISLWKTLGLRCWCCLFARPLLQLRVAMTCCGCRRCSDLSRLGNESGCQ